MASDGKIYIIVTNQLPGGTTVVPGVEPDKKEDEEKNKSVQSFAVHKFFNFLESQAKQAVNYSISNIGNFTGDYATQQHVSDAMQAVGFLVDVGTAAYTGAKIGGGYGALIMAGIAIASKGITIGEQYYANQVEGARQNRAINQLRTRAGLNGSNNGSRGTDQ